MSRILVSLSVVMTIGPKNKIHVSINGSTQAAQKPGKKKKEE